MKTIEIPQPTGYPRCFNFITKKGKRSYKHNLEAVLTKDVERFSTGMTVGCGIYSRPSIPKRIGSMIGIYGYFDDDRVIVDMLDGGYTVLHKDYIKLVNDGDKKYFKFKETTC